MDVVKLLDRSKGDTRQRDGRMDGRTDGRIHGRGEAYRQEQRRQRAKPIGTILFQKKNKRSFIHPRGNKHGRRFPRGNKHQRRFISMEWKRIITRGRIDELSYGPILFVLITAELERMLGRRNRHHNPLMALTLNYKTNHALKLILFQKHFDMTLTQFVVLSHILWYIRHSQSMIPSGRYLDLIIIINKKSVLCFDQKISSFFYFFMIFQIFHIFSFSNYPMA